jgi:hypothetical protein
MSFSFVHLIHTLRHSLSGLFIVMFLLAPALIAHRVDLNADDRS